jgi:hypothetical protein
MHMCLIIALWRVCRHVFVFMCLGPLSCVLLSALLICLSHFGVGLACGDGADLNRIMVFVFVRYVCRKLPEVILVVPGTCVVGVL